MSYLSPDFDPSTQLLNYTSILGESQLSFDDLQSYLISNLQVSLIYGCRIGCAGLMAITLWLISKNRRTPIFILNQLSLVFLIIHSVLYICYLFGPFNSITMNFTGFDLATTGARSITVATNIIQVLLILCIEASLVFQVKIIFRSPEVYKLGLFLTFISTLTGLASVGSYLAACIRSIMSLYNDKPLGNILTNLPIILFAVSTIFICLILMTKLGLAIRSRRYLGLKQFDTLHILIIMTSQTMIIPTILIILSFGYITTIFSRLTPIAIMLVTLQLPLSSMWASSANNSSEPTSSGDSFTTTRTSSRTSYPTIVSSNGSTYYNDDMNSPGIEKLQHHDSNSEYQLYPRKKLDIESAAAHNNMTGLDSYELDDEDKLLWEEANRLTSYYDDGENDNDEYVSTVVHKINSTSDKKF